MSTEEEEIWCECSDDEKYNPAKYKKGTWEPKPEDILKIFEEVKTKKVSVLWKHDFCQTHWQTVNDLKFPTLKCLTK